MNWEDYYFIFICKSIFHLNIIPNKACIIFIKVYFFAGSILLFLKLNAYKSLKRMINLRF